MREPDATPLGLHSACGATVYLHTWVAPDTYYPAYYGLTEHSRLDCEGCEALPTEYIDEVTTRDQRDYIDGATVDELRQERVRLLAEPVGDVGEALWTYLRTISTELRRRANG